jgi:hypothetical protein
MWIFKLGEMHSISAEVFYFAFAFQSTLATLVLRHVASVHWLGTAAPTLFIPPGESFVACIDMLAHSVSFFFRPSNTWKSGCALKLSRCFANRRVPRQTSHLGIPLGRRQKRDSQLTVKANGMILKLEDPWIMDLSFDQLTLNFSPPSANTLGRYCR